jgi:hypothetical protein
VKSFFRVSVCLIVLMLGCIVPAAAQEPQPAAPQAQQPAAAPAAPAQQPPATPPQPEGPRIQAPPQIPKVPDVRQPGETGWWLGVTGWFPRQEPVMDKGKDAAFDTATFTRLQGKPKYAGAAELGIAMGLHYSLRISYMSTRASGDFTATQDLHLWDQTYAKGTLVSTDYRLQHGVISFDYLTWPYPVGSRRFRLKTLWQVQYTGIRAGFDAPLLPITDENGFPGVDASGKRGGQWRRVRLAGALLRLGCRCFGQRPLWTLGDSLRSQGLPLQDKYPERVLLQGDALLRLRRSALVFGLAGVRPPSNAISSTVNSRHLPISRSPIRIGPIAVRTSFSTLPPTASIILRTCRLRPSVIVISRYVYLALSRSRSTLAGRVGARRNPYRLSG